MALALAASAALSGCGASIGLSGKSKKPEAEAVSLERADTPQSRLIQVSSTAARASYCAFGMDKAKLKSSYLSYERSQGATPETIDKMSGLYDKTYALFYEKVRQNPESCSKDDIEDIRPDINRHLAGDFSPAKRKPQARANVDAPNTTLKQDRIDITKGGIDNDVFKAPSDRY